MATKFTTFAAELVREAKAEGRDAVAELKYFRERFSQARRTNNQQPTRKTDSHRDDGLKMAGKQALRDRD